MAPRHFSADGEALPVRESKGDALREWLYLLYPPMAIGGTLLGFWLIFQGLTTPVTVSPMPSAAPSSDAESDPTFPPELLKAADAISMYLAPTPTVTPAPYKTPTPPVPTIYCGINSTSGQTCTWPQPTIVATEIPTCSTPMPLSDCRWMGAVVSTPIATATAESGHSKGT